jgi:hypothetical protein
VTAHPLGVGGGAHAREERGGLAVAERVEQHRGAGALAVVVVPRPRVVVAVGNRALVDVPAQEAAGLRDRAIQVRLAHAGLARDDQREC